MLDELLQYVEPDEYGDTRIYNIYYDTPDYQLIRRSIEKPIYKEKLYKRRISLPYLEAKRHLDKGVPFQDMELVGSKKQGNVIDIQIEHEINSMVRYYKKLRPGMMISYDRLAFKGIEDPGFRVTFDKNIRWRDYDMK